MQERKTVDDLRWDDLRAFLAVARDGTLAAAAPRVGVDASTLHRRLAALEAALGARLFDRAPRGYTLTATGEALLTRAREVEEAVLALRRAATGHDRTAVGPVTLTLPETLLGLVTPHLAAVVATCPGLRPVVRADDRLVELGEEADVALRASEAPPPDAIGRRLATVGWAVYGVGPDAPWVTYAAPGGPPAARAWQERNVPAGEVWMEVGSVGAMHRVLGCALARGLLPCYLGDPDPVLVRLSPVLPEVSAGLWLLVHADLRRSARVRALLDVLEPRLHADAALLAGAAGGPPPTPPAAPPGSPSRPAGRSRGARTPRTPPG